MSELEENLYKDRMPRFTNKTAVIGTSSQKATQERRTTQGTRSNFAKAGVDAQFGAIGRGE